MKPFNKWVTTRNPSKIYSIPEKTGRLEDFSPHQLRTLYFQEMANEIERLEEIIDSQVVFVQILKTNR